MRRPNVAFYLSLLVFLYLFSSLLWFLLAIVLAIGISYGIECVKNVPTLSYLFVPKAIPQKEKFFEHAVAFFLC